MSGVNFSGRWITSFGPMELAQHGSRVVGGYRYLGQDCPIEGSLTDGRLQFDYQEGTLRGSGWFQLQRRGQGFSGEYREEGAALSLPWQGVRIGFDGLWDSTFGPLRLLVHDGGVEGFYEVDGAARISGRFEGDTLDFEYQEPGAEGEGRFTLSDDGMSFQGEWKARGAARAQAWNGRRRLPRHDLTWLVVFEAPWQRFLDEPEYAFGHMLRAFFARVEHVSVRHRFFTNEAALRRSCRDLLYLAEPVTLVVATHGLANGIPVDGGTIPLPTLLDYLRPVSDLRLLHFSACLLLQERSAESLLRRFTRETGTAVSGYRTAVGWAASAILEFTYLELILSQGLPPAAAAEQVHQLLAFAGETVPPGTALAPAHFRFIV